MKQPILLKQAADYVPSYNNQLILNHIQRQQTGFHPRTMKEQQLMTIDDEDDDLEHHENDDDVNLTQNMPSTQQSISLSICPSTFSNEVDPISPPIESISSLVYVYFFILYSITFHSLCFYVCLC